MAEGGLPRDLKGFRLEPKRGGWIRKLIILAIIILIVLWFVNRQVVFDLYDWIREIIVSFL